MSEKHAFRVSGVAHKPHCTEYKFDDSGALIGYCGLPVYHSIHALKAVEGEPTKDDLLEEAWGVIANAGEGDWGRESPTWQIAAHNWGVRAGFRLGEPMPFPAPESSSQHVAEKHEFIEPPLCAANQDSCDYWAPPMAFDRRCCLPRAAHSQHVETEPPTPDHAFRSLLPRANSKCDVCGVSGSIHGEPPALDMAYVERVANAIENGTLESENPSPAPPTKEQVEGAKDEAAVIAVRHIGHDEECPDCGRAEDAYLIDFPCSPPTAACTCDGEPLATAIRSALAAAQRENDELRALLKEAGAQRYHSDVCEIWHGEKDCNCGADALSTRIAAALKEPQK